MFENRVSPGSSPRKKLGIWLWIYAAGRLSVDPFLFLRALHHVADRLYFTSLSLVTLAGMLAAIFIVLRHRASLVVVSADLALRLAADWTYYVHAVLHPLHPARNPGVHAILIFWITLYMGVMPTCLWFLYFNQSRRVRALLGANLGSWLIPPPIDTLPAPTLV